MRQSQLREPFGVSVDEPIEAELLNETVQLAQRRWPLVQVDEMRFDPPFGEEAEGFARFSAFFGPEHLNFHRSVSAVIDRGRPFCPGPCFVPPHRRSEYTYRPAWWVPGAHAQTLWGKFFRPRSTLATRLERWETPDGDFIDLHRLDGPTHAPRLLFLHGLEGTVRSHYVAGFFAEAQRRGWAADLMIFRGCGDEPNRAPRFYHSGETTDLAFVLDRLLCENPHVPVVLAGVSLGGNVLLKFLGERGTGVPRQLRAAAVISVPFDLERGSRFIATGISRIYDRHFLRTLRPKAMAKLRQFPDLFDRSRLDRATSIYDFDDAVTAPVHGFADAHDYYSRSSSLGWISRVRVPTLLLSAVDDPFLPADVLDEVRAIAKVNDALTVEFTKHGGHVGFIAGRWPWRPFYFAEWRACEFLQAGLES
jgi:predicted alpha/beta-fold hydrolase